MVPGDGWGIHGKDSGQKCQISFGTGLSGHLRGTMSSDTPREGAGTFWELTGDSGALVLSLDKGPEGSEKWK